MHRAHVQGVGDGFAEFFLVVGDRAARSTQSKRRPYHQRESQLIAEPQRVLRVVDQSGSRHLKSDLAASVLKPKTVFRDLDGSQRSADRKSTRLNSSHDQISDAVFCLKKKKKKRRGRGAAKHAKAEHNNNMTERH